MFVQPALREQFVTLFKDVLGCNVMEHEAGFAFPLLLVTFPNGSSFSVEFTELAPRCDARSVDDESAFRGPWLEFRTADLQADQEKLRAAGIKEFRHQGSLHAYFAAPGGQVFRLVDVDYKGP